MKQHEDVMMDHALRTVCFICDIGDIMVLMSRRLTTDLPDLKVEDGSSVSLANVMAEREKRTSKNICHIFQCDQVSLTVEICNGFKSEDFSTQFWLVIIHINKPCRDLKGSKYNQFRKQSKTGTDISDPPGPM